MMHLFDGHLFDGCHCQLSSAPNVGLFKKAGLTLDGLWLRYLLVETIQHFVFKSIS